MGRPYDWSPLGLAADPVPGDPGAIAGESGQLAQTAQQLHAQISLLSKIGSDATLKGHYAGTIRAHAQQLAQDLGKVATRYEKVAGAVQTWSGDLEHAQSLSLTALRMADGPHAQLQKLQPPQAPPGTPTARQEQQLAQDQQSYQAVLSNAEGELAAAQRILNEATGHRDTAGRRAAGRIRGASHDKLADSWWDSFKESISAVAGHLKLVAQILGWIATAAALAAAIFSGAALVFLLIAAGLLLTELFIHVILAATGNGSWMDVGLDVAALVTLGYGGYAEGTVTGLEQTARTAGEQAIAEGLGTEVTTVQRAFQSFKATAAQLGLDVSDKGLLAKTEALGRDIPAIAKDAVKTAKPAETSFPGKIRAVLQAGSLGVHHGAEFIRNMAALAPGNLAIREALSQAGGFAVKNRNVFLSGTTIDGLDKLLSDVHAPGYETFKESLTGALPGGIGIPVTFFAENWTPAGFAVRSVQWAS